MAYITEISLPDAPDLDLPTAPNVPDITLPAAPNIDIDKFDIPTPFLDTIEQTGILEKMLVDFFQTQQNRFLQAQQALAANAIEIFNATVARQSLLLDQYKIEVQVFESKIRAELAAIEVYGGLNAY